MLRGFAVSEWKPQVSDDQILEALGSGDRTHYVAQRLGMLSHRSYIYRRLLALESAGRVFRDCSRSQQGSIYWVNFSE